MAMKRRNKEDFSIFECGVYNLDKGQEGTTYRIDIPGTFDDLSFSDLECLHELLGKFIASRKEKPRHE